MSAAALFAEGSFQDPKNARIIFLAAGGLVILAVALAVGTFVWWRSAKVEHPALGPLEAMGSRKWWKGDFTTRNMRLEKARPEGALRDPADESRLNPVDLKASVNAAPPQFDDLVEPEVVEPDVVEPDVDVVAVEPDVVADEVEVDADETDADETDGMVAVDRSIDPLLRTNSAD